MRLLIASDIHGAPDSVEFLLRKAEELRPEACVLLGDMLYHGPRNPLPGGYAPKDVAAMLGNFSVPVMGIRGNCDAEVDMMILPFTLATQAWLYGDGLRILALHGHTLLQGPLHPTPAAGTVILSGHTHVPTACTADGLHWWNPGSLTLPKQGYPRSYAVLENGLFRVLDMQDQCFMEHRP